MTVKGLQVQVKWQPRQQLLGRLEPPPIIQHLHPHNQKLQTSSAVLSDQVLKIL